MPLRALPPQSSMSTNFITWAWVLSGGKSKRIRQRALVSEKKILERGNFAQRHGRQTEVLHFSNHKFLPLLAGWLLATASLFCQTRTVQLSLELAADESSIFEKNLPQLAADAQVSIEKKSVNLWQTQSPDVPKFCQNLLQFFREKAFLAASIDSLTADTSGQIFRAKIHLGPAMRWVKLRPAASVNPRFLAAAGWREADFSGQKLDPARILQLENRLLETAENSGYPFAQIWLDSLELSPDDGAAATLQLAENQFFTFGKTNLRGDVRLPAGYLPRLLGLRSGSVFSREKILRVPARLRDLPFLEMTANPTVNFTNSQAEVNLFLKKRRTTRFDFLLGLLPQPDGSPLLTGTLTAQFQNALNAGEKFDLDLERLRPETQRLDLETSVPYLAASLPVGATARLHLYRRDSAWVEARGELGIQYFFSGADALKIFWESRSTFLQKVDTATVRRTRQLPPQLDFSESNFGLETSVERLDYRFNPRRGWRVSGRASAGFSQVNRNPAIESLNDSTFSFSRLYDSLAVRAARFGLEVRGEIYLPVLGRAAVKLAARGGAIFSPDRPVFANEQYRLGGQHPQRITELRGFDEESLFATKFVVGTAEFRLLLGQNSWLAAFADVGYLENFTANARLILRPLGFGAGLNFETRAGVFGISVAVGSRQIGVEGVDFRGSKIHLGYVSLF